MQAIMLAAGVGARLSNNDETYLPKCLLQFDGQSLLARHVEILKSNGVEKLTLVVGYRENDIAKEIAAIGVADFVETVTNPQYREGSIVSLATAAKIMRSGDEILFMDGDVLYHPDLIRKLVSADGDCLLFDPDFEPGDEPVKLCLKDNQIVEFAKIVDVEFDSVGEWPGFVKWSPRAAEQIADFTDRIVGEGSIDHPYEEAFREYLLSSDGANTLYENITGLPWIEIDFPEDLEHARDIILPQLKS
jgi:choline kinase